MKTVHWLSSTQLIKERKKKEVLFFSDLENQIFVFIYLVCWLPENKDNTPVPIATFKNNKTCGNPGAKILFSQKGRESVVATRGDGGIFPQHLQ